MRKKASTHDAITWAKHRLDDVDAIISEAEKATVKLKDDTRAEADAALAHLRASRAKVSASYDQLRAESGSSLEKAQEALEAEWIEVEAAFQSFLTATKDQAETARAVVVARAQAQRNSWEAILKDLRDKVEETVEKTWGGYLDAAKVDLATRKSILEAELEARQAAWQRSLEELRADAAKLASNQRAAIDAQIAALNAQMDEAKARLGRLQDTSTDAWKITKKGLADTQQVFLKTYASIRRSIEDSMK